jgi:hypothetical protein
MGDGDTDLSPARYEKQKNSGSSNFCCVIGACTAAAFDSRLTGCRTVAEPATSQTSMHSFGQ